METILYAVLGIIGVLLLLPAALRWSVRAAERGGHSRSDGHFRDCGEGCGDPSPDGD